MRWDYSYFNKEPFVDVDGLDYYGGGEYESKPLYSFHHKMADILMACLENGLALDYIEELPDHICNTFWNVETQGPRLPMSYILVAQKET